MLASVASGEKGVFFPLTLSEFRLGWIFLGSRGRRITIVCRHISYSN